MTRSRRARAAFIFTVAALLLEGATARADAAVDATGARCRSAVALQERTYADAVLAQTLACARDRMRGKLPADAACADLSAATFPDRSLSAIAGARARLVSRIESACTGVSPATLDYTACPSPCDAVAPALASFAAVAECVACTVESEVETAMAQLYGGAPPVLGRDTAERCQSSNVANGTRAYVRAVLHGRRSCQAKVDAGTWAADCATEDPSGSIASAAKRLASSVARCSDVDLAALTSCADTVAEQQVCTRAAGDAMADALFALVRPEGDAVPSCAADGFLDLTGAPGAGPGYAVPTLTASCDDHEVIVSSNSIPPYTFVATTPNPLVVNQKTYRFPRTPQVAASTTPIPLLNGIAIAVNGMPIFGPNEAMMPDPYGDPVSNGILDGCLGHTAFVYHYHALVVKCLTEAGLVAEPWTLADPPSDEPSPVIGYAFDGFPIYGPTAAPTRSAARWSSTRAAGTTPATHRSTARRATTARPATAARWR